MDSYEFTNQHFSSTISSAVESLYRNEKFSDVVIYDMKGNKVHAHKLILATSSHFFNTIFKVSLQNKYNFSKQ